MKLPFSAALSYARAALRRWLRHTWISRLPLGGIFHVSSRRNRAKRAPRRQPSFRPCLGILEEREVPGSVLDVLAAPALLATLAQTNDDLATNSTALLNSLPSSPANNVVNSSPSNMPTPAETNEQREAMLDALTTDWDKNAQLISQDLSALANTPLGQGIEQADKQLGQELGTAHNIFEMLVNDAEQLLNNEGKQLGLNNPPVTPPGNNNDPSKMAGSGGGGGGGASTPNAGGGGGGGGGGGSLNLYLPNQSELQQMTSGANGSMPITTTPPSAGSGGANGAAGQQTQANMPSNPNTTSPSGPSGGTSSATAPPSSPTVASLASPNTALYIPQTASTTSLTTSASTDAPGQNVTFTATVKAASGSNTPTGTVAFYDGSTLLDSKPLVVNNGQNQAALTTAALPAGSQAIVAIYDGDSNFAASNAALTETVQPAVTSLRLSSSSNSVAPGQTLTLTASVATVSGGGTPTGNIVFNDGSTNLGNGDVNYDSSTGQYQATLTVTTLATTGVHPLTAIYSGDSSHAGAVAALAQLVAPVATSVTLTSSAFGSLTPGQQVILTATVAAVPGGSAPTGDVLFYDDSTIVGNGTVSYNSSIGQYQASCTTNDLMASGYHNLSAVYGGDNTHAGGLGALSQLVALGSTNLMLSSSSGSIQPGQSVTFTATVSSASGGGTPSGNVKFYVGTTYLGSDTLTAVNGQQQAIWTTSLLTAAGANDITALYSGDGTFAGSSGSLMQYVNGTGSRQGTFTSLNSSANPSLPGQSVTFTATVSGGSGTPTGSVAFYDGTTSLGSQPLAVNNGQNQAKWAVTNLSLGNHAITAIYSGDNNFLASTGALPSGVPQKVNEGFTTTQLSSSPNPSLPGQTVTFTATVTGPANAGTPTGSVDFYDGQNRLNTESLSLVNGLAQASIPVTSLALGSHEITAVYSGNNVLAGSSASLSSYNVQAVNAGLVNAQLTSSANPSLPDQLVTFTATLSGAYGSGTPSGTVDFYDGATLMSTKTLSLVNGMDEASYQTSNLALGGHEITAVYSGDNVFASTSFALSAPQGQNVNQASAPIQLTSSNNPAQPNQAVTFTARLSAVNGVMPTGNIAFYDGQTMLQTIALTNINGQAQASFPTSNLAAGQHDIVALYSGDTTYANSAAALMQTVLAATSTSIGTPTVSGSNTSVTVTVQPQSPVQGTSTGTVMLYNGSTLLASQQLPTGLNQLTFSVPTPTGTPIYRAIYGGDANFAASQASLTPKITTPPVLTSEGQLFSARVGAFVDGDGNIDASKYTALINWGDKQTSSGTVAYSSSTGTLQISGNHKYAEEGSYTVTATITDQDGATFTVVNTAIVQDAKLTGSNAGPLQAVQGSTFQGTLGSFTDADPAGVVGDYTAIINWGDGATSTGRLSGSGPFTVTGSHVYKQTGSYTVKVTVTDQGTASTTLQDQLTVAAPALPYTPGSPSFVEGATASTQNLATFTDPSNTDPSKYSASIDWGDQTFSGTGSISYLGNHTFQISGMHGYAEEGKPSITITLTDSLTNKTQTILVSATVNDAPLTASALTVNANVGTYLSAVVANFTDANSKGSKSDFTATINWGDKSSTAVDSGVIVPGQSGGFAVRGGHTYTTAGTYSVTVTITDTGRATTTATSTVTVGAATQTLVIDDLSFTEGQAFDDAVATYTPPSGSSGSYTAKIGWGDGSVTDGTLTPNGNSGYTISGTHTYSEETSSGQPYTLTVTVQPATGGSGTPLTSSTPVTVDDADLTPTALDLTGWTNTPTADLVVGQFSDANPGGSLSDFTASIDWGDDSTPSDGTVQVNPDGGFAVTGDHTYTASGNYDVTITVRDDGGATTTIDSTIAIADASTSITATECNAFDGVVGTFNGNVNDATEATIDWGDGTQTSGTIAGNSSSFTVSGTHTYTDEGTYPLGVTVQMSQGDPLTASGPATVNDADLTATGVNLTVNNGQPLGQVVVANFTDANPYASLSDYSATIDWGDGETTEGTVQQNGDGWQVLGDHTYADADSYDVTVTINDVGGATATADSTINAAVVEGQDYALALQMAAPSGSGDAEGTSYTATIDWGDGSEPTLGTVSVVAGSSPLQLLVTSDHVYTEEGDYAISVTLADANDNQTNASTNVTVVDAPLTGYGLDVSGVAGGSSGTVTLGGFSDQNAYATTSDYSVSIDWGDDSGVDDVTGQVESLADSNFQVTGDHVYTTPGTYIVTTTVTDDGDESTSFTSTADVAGAWSIVGGQTAVRSNDPTNAQLVPIGEATVDLNQGGLRLSQGLDFDQSPGTDVGGNPALVYNSVTADALPTIQLAVQGDPLADAPTQAVVQLTWDGVAQTPQTYTLDQPAGSVYLFSVQPDSAVGTSGAYGWSATVTFTIPGQDNEQVTTAGTAYVVSSAGSAYGAGWGIDGISQLVVGAAGAMLVTGQGDYTFFASNGSGGFISPPNDFGTLVQNDDGSYTYTAVGQTQYNYNSLGYLTSVVDTHGLATTYAYDSDNRLVQVTAIDGGITTLAYDPVTGLLDTITEPGNRVLTLTHDVYGNLTQIQDVDGTTRTFGYAEGSNHLLTEDQWSPLDATFNYDPTTNQLTQVDLGLVSTYAIVSAASAGLGTMAATGEAWASITNGDGDQTQYLLDPLGRLLEEIEPDGTSTTRYVLNDAGLPIVTIDPMGRPTLDSYGSFGDLLQETAADGSWTQYQYDPTFHKVTQTLDSMGETTSNTYDPATGDLLTSTDALGAVTSYAYYQTNGISNGLVYSVTTPTELGLATSYNYYDSARRLIASFDNLGVPTYYTYDSNGNPSTTTNVYGQTTETVYDAKNQLLQSIDALGAITSYAYNAYGQQISTTDARGFTSTTSYDQRGWVTAQADDMGITTEEDTYDAAGNLIEQTDADGNPTEYAYNADGEQVETLYADGTTSNESYDADGEVVSSTDQMGLTTTNAYNSVGEEVATMDPMGRTSTSEYDSDGDVIRSTDPMGLSTLDFYNADGEEIASAQQVSAGVWATDTTQYDKAGEAIASTDALGHVTTDNFNADGEDTGSTDADGKTATNVYDLLGNLIQSTDANGKVTTYAYNADGQQVSSTDADGNVTWMVYDADGNLIQTINPQGTTSNLYDGDDREIASTDADGNVTQTAFDNNGNVVASIDAKGQVTQNWYNDLNEEVVSEDADGNFTQTAYNADGEVVATTDGAGGLTQNGYDADGEQTSTTDGDGNVTQFAFNGDGQQISQTDANGNTTQYVLDGLGNRVATVDAQGHVEQSVYNLAGQLVAQVDATGHTTTSQYDSDGNLLLQVDGAGQTSSYAYDGDGNRTLAIQGYGTRAASTTVWQYDGDGNTTLEIDGAGHSTSYAYDGNGNQALVVTGFNTSSAETTSYAYDGDGNQTLVVTGFGTGSAESTSYAYDANGNQTLQLTGPAIGGSERHDAKPAGAGN